MFRFEHRCWRHFSCLKWLIFQFWRLNDDLDILSTEHTSFTDSYSPAKVIFYQHGLCLFWVRFSHPLVGNLFWRQYISTHVDRQPMEHSQTTWTHRCWCCASEIWGAILLRSWSKWRPWLEGIFPSANQRASLSFMLKLIGWWHLNSFASQIKIAIIHQNVNTVLLT